MRFDEIWVCISAILLVDSGFVYVWIKRSVPSKRLMNKDKDYRRRIFICFTCKASKCDGRFFALRT